MLEAKNWKITLSTYSQIFRNGILEVVDTILVSLRSQEEELPKYGIEKKVMDQATDYVVLLDQLGFQTACLRLSVAEWYQRI
jgi:hypothetical protein